MKTLHWILGALGAAALAVPAVASAGDYENEPEGNGSDAQLGVQSDDEGAQIEGNGDNLQGCNCATEGDHGTGIQGNGEQAWAPESGTLQENGTGIQGNGAAWQGDQYAEARARQERREGPDKGLKVEAQGGVLSYPGEAASQVTPGGMYGVVVGIEPPIPVFELELGYQGAAYQTDSRLAGAQENIVENGGQAVLMASPEIGAFEPYAFGGYQLSRLNVYERPNASGAVTDDTLSKVPVGAGLDVHLGDVLVGARGTYNFVFSDQAFTNLPQNAGNRSADQLTGSLLVGGQF